MGKAKDGSECFTKTNKSGGKYVTCKGTQGKSKAPVKSKAPEKATEKQKELMRKRRAEAKAKKAKPKPKPNYTNSLDDFDFMAAFTSHKKGIDIDLFMEGMSVMATRNKQRIAEAPPKPSAAQIRAKDNRESFENQNSIGDKVYFRSGKNEKAKIISGTIEAFTDKGIVMRADKGKIEKRRNSGFNSSTNYIWTPTGGTQKKVVSWGRSRGSAGYINGRFTVDTIGG